MSIHTLAKTKCWVTVQAIAVAFLVAAVSVLTYYSFRTHEALCTFRNDLEQRYDNGKKFLVAHPEGVAGISRSEIERSLSAQRATLNSLSELDCD